MATATKQRNRERSESEAVYLELKRKDKAEPWSNEVRCHSRDLSPLARESRRID